MNKNTKLIFGVLALAVVLLGIGEIYIIARGSSPAQPAVAGASGASQANTSPALPSNVLMPMSGKVKGVAGSTITLSSMRPTGAADVLLAVSKDTIIVLQGNLKDGDTRNAEMDAFRKQSEALAKDPIKNKQALEHLIAPSPYVEKPIALSDVKAGDMLSALVDGQNSGAYAAFKIVVVR